MGVWTAGTFTSIIYNFAERSPHLSRISDADDPVALEGFQAVPDSGHVRRIVPETALSVQFGGNVLRARPAFRTTR